MLFSSSGLPMGSPVVRPGFILRASGGTQPSRLSIPHGPVSSSGVIQTKNLVSSNLLSSTATRYDELGRAYQTDQSLFLNSAPTKRPPDVAAGARGLGKLNLNPETCSVPGLTEPASFWKGCASDRVEYDADSRVTFAISDSGEVASNEYDGAGRLIQTRDPVGNVMQVAYDGDGNVIETRETDVPTVPSVKPEVFLTTNFYDSVDRLTESVDNLGETTYFQYDSRDNLIATADANGPLGPVISRRAFADGAKIVDTTNLPGNVSTYTYDGLDRVTSQVWILTKSGGGNGTFSPRPDPSQGSQDGLITLRYTYDPNSNVATETDANGNQTQYSYDDADQLIKETIGVCVAPHLASTCVGPKSAAYTYDAGSLLKKMVDENGSTTTFNYDAADRLVATSERHARRVTGSTSSAYQYDGLDRLTSAFDNNGGSAANAVTTGLSYDSLGRVVEDRQKIGTSPFTAVDSAWRGDGLRSALTYPNGRVVSYRYDALDRIASVSGPGSAKPLATYSYIGHGRLLERDYPINGTKLTYVNDAGTVDTGYDGLGRPVQSRVTGPGGILITGYRYTFDRVGNPHSKTALQAPDVSELYKYDSANRLLDFNRGVLNPSRTAIQTPSP
jgi:YD repeat-containing protein